MKRYSLAILIAFLALMVLVSGCGNKRPQVTITGQATKAPLATFKETNDDICRDTEGKPLIRMFSTSWCPHCKWVKPTYIKVVNEYVAQGKIAAHLWEVDKNDNLLTEENDPVPSSEQAVFAKYNPEGSIPTFVFGCKYVRVGNAYEHIDDKEAEEAEFHTFIDKLLEEKL